MSPEDIALCQAAIDLANSGDRQMAYEQFCKLESNNPEDITVLSWIAYTTPNLEEAQRVRDTIGRLEPDHPALPALRDFVAQKEEREQQRQAYQRREEEKARREQEAKEREIEALYPTLTCPYCHYTGHSRRMTRAATAGWVCFVILIITVVFIPICWVPLLMFRDLYLVCGRCGLELGRV